MQEPKRKSKSKKLPPYMGERPFVPTEFEEITEEEINNAFKVWDEVMPDHKGMLDAKIIKKDDDAG